MHPDTALFHSFRLCAALRSPFCSSGVFWIQLWVNRAPPPLPCLVVCSLFILTGLVMEYACDTACMDHSFWGYHDIILFFKSKLTAQEPAHIVHAEVPALCTGSFMNDTSLIPKVGLNTLQTCDPASMRCGVTAEWVLLVATLLPECLRSSHRLHEFIRYTSVSYSVHTSAPLQ